MKTVPASSPWATPDADDSLGSPGLRLMLNREGRSISHNLRTVVVDPRGRIHRQFDGNDWTPEELAEGVVAAAQVP